MRFQSRLVVWSVLALASACGGEPGGQASDPAGADNSTLEQLADTSGAPQEDTQALTGTEQGSEGDPQTDSQTEAAADPQEQAVREMIEAAYNQGADSNDPEAQSETHSGQETAAAEPDAETDGAASESSDATDPEASTQTEEQVADNSDGQDNNSVELVTSEQTDGGSSAQRTNNDQSVESQGPNPDGETLEGPVTGSADKPYECIWQETQDAVKCGTSVVRDAAVCGYEITRDAALCGTQVVTDAAVCGSEYVTDAAKCGVSTVTDAGRCGVDTVKDAAICGTETVKDAAICGTKTITSAAICGTETIHDLVKCGLSVLSGKTSCEVAKSCKVAAECSVAKSCSVPKSCDIPNTCQIAKSCTVAAECEIAAECEVAKTCDVNICKQTQPGGQCTPGLAECDVNGFSCQISGDSQVFRCLPNYKKDLDVTDEAVCKSLYVPALSQMAQDAQTTFAYSAGASASVGAKASAEVGTVYGENGEYGCFVSTCAGIETDIQISDFANLGAYINWDVFAGESKTFSFGASIPEVELGVSTTSVLDATFDQYIGQVDSVSLGLGLAPAQVGHGTCDTAVYVVDVQ